MSNKQIVEILLKEKRDTAPVTNHYLVTYHASEPDTVRVNWATMEVTRFNRVPTHMERLPILDATCTGTEKRPPIRTGAIVKSTNTLTQETVDDFGRVTIRDFTGPDVDEMLRAKDWKKRAYGHARGRKKARAKVKRLKQQLAFLKQCDDFLLKFNEDEIERLKALVLTNETLLATLLETLKGWTPSTDTVVGRQRKGRQG
jgi:hypothetical protein